MSTRQSDERYIMSDLELELEALLSRLTPAQQDAFLTLCLGGNHARTDAAPARQARRVRVIAAEKAERAAKLKLRRGGWHYPNCPEASISAYNRVHDGILCKQLGMVRGILGADER